MKKVLSLAIVIVMVLSLAVTASASWQAATDLDVDWQSGATLPGLTIARGSSATFVVDLKFDFPNTTTPTAAIAGALQGRPITLAPDVTVNGVSYGIGARSFISLVDTGAGANEIVLRATVTVTAAASAPLGTFPVGNLTFTMAGAAGAGVAGAISDFETIGTIEITAAAPQDTIGSRYRIRGFATNAADDLDTQFLIGRERAYAQHGPNTRMLGDSELWLHLTPDMFTWETQVGSRWESVAYAPAGELNAGHLDRISVTHRVIAGDRDRIRDVRVVMGGADRARVGRLSIRTPVYMTRTDRQNVSLDITLRVGNDRLVIDGWDIEIGNNRVNVWGNDRHVIVNHREYLRADENVRNLEIEAGEITFFRDITNERQIYVYASTELSFSGEAMYRQFPEIIDIIEVYHVGMNVAGVRWEIEGRSTNFVYDGRTGAYLGTTNDTFQGFRDRVILTTARIDRELAAALGGAVEEPVQEPQDPANPPGGGAPTAPPNVNLNPGTGR